MSKYNVGDKFIIEISKNDTNELDNTEYYITNGSRVYEKEELDKLQKYEEEQIPYSEAYNKGLNDAWELARKIFTFNDNKIKEIFGVAGKRSAFDDLSPQEALAKLEAYEKKIEVGDVIERMNDGAKFLIITEEHDSSEYDFGVIVLQDMTIDRITGSDKHFKKTGKHIDIQSVLQQIAE